jgi:hypothetical protein
VEIRREWMFVSWVLSIDQPAIFLEKMSITAQQRTFPPRVGCSVMSVTQSPCDDKRWNLRCTRSSDVEIPWSRRALPANDHGDLNVSALPAWQGQTASRTLAECFHHRQRPAHSCCIVARRKRG